MPLLLENVCVLSNSGTSYTWPCLIVVLPSTKSDLRLPDSRLTPGLATYTVYEIRDLVQISCETYIVQRERGQVQFRRLLHVIVHLERDGARSVDKRENAAVGKVDHRLDQHANVFVPSFVEK